MSISLMLVMDGDVGVASWVRPRGRRSLSHPPTVTDRLSRPDRFQSRCVSHGAWVREGSASARTDPRGNGEASR